MPIVVARHAGFCMGVNRAVAGALQAARDARSDGLPCFTLGDLIHNASVVSRLRSQGIVPVSEPSQAEGGVLILRSHGVSPETLEAGRGSARKVVDCTCPFVDRLHRAVSAFSRDGAPVILAGDRDHPEIQGTAGWCRGEVFIVAEPEDVGALPDRAGRALVVSQTTFPPERWESLVAALLARFPDLKVERTICAATSLRQQDARELARKADCMVVVGSRHSANTQALYNACKKLCKRTYLVEGAADLPPRFADPRRELIGVTAGASTPEWSLKEVIDSMNDMERDPQAEQPETYADTALPSDAEPAPEAPAQTKTADSGPVVADSDEPAAAPQPETPASDAAAVSEASAQTDMADNGPVAVDSDEPSAVSQPETPASDATEPSEASTAPATAGERDSDDHTPQEAVSAQPVSFMDQVAASIMSIRNGQTVTGKVIQITDDEISVNIGYKTDGLIKRSDLVDQGLQLGDEVMVEVLKVNDGEGNVILSQRNVVNRRVWDELMAKYEAGEFVDAVGKEAVKGGLLASMNGVRAFVPASHLSQRYVDRISQFVGQPMRLKIIEVDKVKRRVVASRKEVLAAESESKKQEAWARLSEGEVVRGIVRRFASFGAFVDLGGVDGLIHITDLSWNRSAAPSDILRVNQEVEVKILSLDRERERIQLGYKQLQPKPWDGIEDRYQVGSVIIRKVVRIRPFGAFVEIEPGVDGLVHISQVAPTRINRVEDVLTAGQEVRVKILAIDPEAKRISLSIREAMDDYAFDYAPEYQGYDAGGEYHGPQDAAYAYYDDPSAAGYDYGYAAAGEEQAPAPGETHDSQTEEEAPSQEEGTPSAEDA